MKKIRVFVYGSLMRGYGNNKLLVDQSFVGEATTDNADWDMLSLGYFPGVIPGPFKIHGEVYEVDEKTLSNLDILEGNGVFYNREVVETSLGPAWMYVLMDYCMGEIDEHVIARTPSGGLRWVNAY